MALIVPSSSAEDGGLRVRPGGVISRAARATGFCRVCVMPRGYALLLVFVCNLGYKLAARVLARLPGPGRVEPARLFATTERARAHDGRLARRFES